MARVRLATGSQIQDNSLGSLAPDRARARRCLRVSREGVLVLEVRFGIHVRLAAPCLKCASPGSRS